MRPTAIAINRSPTRKGRSLPITRQIRVLGGRTPLLVLRLYAWLSIPDSSRKKPTASINQVMGFSSVKSFIFASARLLRNDLNWFCWLEELRDEDISLGLAGSHPWPTRL